MSSIELLKDPNHEKLQAEGHFNSKKNGERELAQQVLIKNEF
jgi:hypothetical protein